MPSRRDKSGRSRKESRRRKSSHNKAKSVSGKILTLSFEVIYGIDYELDEDKFHRTGGKFEMKRVLKNGEITGHRYMFEFQAVGPFEKFLKKYRDYFSK